MDQDAIIQYVTDTFGGVDVVRPTEGPGSGDTFFIYDPERNLDDKHRFPFATIVTKDYGEFDNLSQLDRESVFRLNVGVSQETFRRLFERSPAADADYDFARLDTLMPHPVYARQAWVSILNPTSDTFESVKPLLAEAYSSASKRAH